MAEQIRTVTREFATGEHAVLHVMDRGPHFTLSAELPEDPWSEDGRGLFLIAALGENLSYAPLPVRGNHISVVLPVRRRTEESGG